MEYLKLIIEVILVILGFYLIFFKSYFKKKGENLATKEDIGFITKEIENIKNEFSFQNEKKTDLFFETKKNLMEFYDNFFLWTSGSMYLVDILLNYHNSEKVLRNCIDNLKDSHLNVLSSYSKLLIYVDDNNFKSEISRIYENAKIKHGSLIKFLMELEDISLGNTIIGDRINSVKTKNDSQEIRNEVKNLIERKKDAFNKYSEENLKLKEILSDDTEYLIKMYKKKLKEKYNL